MKERDWDREEDLKRDRTKEIMKIVIMTALNTIMISEDDHDFYIRL